MSVEEVIQRLSAVSNFILNNGIEHQKMEIGPGQIM